MRRCVRARWRPAARQASACAGMPAIASARGSWMRAQTGVECDSFPVLRNLSQGRGPERPRIFGTFVALLQEQYRLSGSPELSRSRRISRGENRAKRRPFNWLQGRERCKKKGINCNALSDRIGPAIGAGADRLIRRGIAGGGHGDGDARACAAATETGGGKKGARQAGGATKTAAGAARAGGTTAAGRRRSAAAAHV